jgi:hypothetical protein
MRHCGRADCGVLRGRRAAPTGPRQAARPRHLHSRSCRRGLAGERAGVRHGSWCRGGVFRVRGPLGRGHRECPCRQSRGTRRGLAKRLAKRSRVAGPPAAWRHHGHPYTRHGRCRRRRRDRRDCVRYLIPLPLAFCRGVGSIEAGPAANNPGPRAFLRQHAPSATRQRTLEANGSDCGASVVGGAAFAARGTARARLSAQASLARHRQVGRDPDGLPDGPGNACSSFPYARPQVGPVPRAGGASPRTSRRSLGGQLSSSPSAPPLRTAAAR